MCPLSRTHANLKADCVGKSMAKKHQIKIFFAGPDGGALSSQLTEANVKTVCHPSSATTHKLARGVSTSISQFPDWYQVVNVAATFYTVLAVLIKIARAVMGEARQRSPSPQRPHSHSLALTFASEDQLLFDGGIEELDSAELLTRLLQDARRPTSNAELASLIELLSNVGGKRVRDIIDLSITGQRLTIGQKAVRAIEAFRMCMTWRFESQRQRTARAEG